MKEIEILKNVLKFVIMIVLATIILITWNLINETENWQVFGIDFQNKGEIVSAYGTLIGGVLSFLSILFVLVSLLEQRQQILQEKQDQVESERIELLNRLKLLSSFIKFSIDNIKLQGEEMKKFYLPEKEFPSRINKMYFTTNKNFTRIVDLDPSIMYKAINQNFRSEPDWEKMFLNIFSLFDFYSEGLKELRQKYDYQVKFKFDEQKMISDDLKKLLNKGARLVDEYKIAFGNDYLKYPWSTLMNNFTPLYYKYLEDCVNKGEMNDLRFISDKLLLPLLDCAMEIRRDYGYDIYGSRDIVDLTSDLRKRIYEVEEHCKNYAEDIEYQYLTYYVEGNESLIKLNQYVAKLDSLAE